MKESTGVLNSAWRALHTTRAWGGLVILGVLAVALIATAISTTGVSAIHGDVEVWPTWYEGDEIEVLMYPIGHNDADLGCFGASPDVTRGAAPKNATDFYILWGIGGATQMHCPNGDNMHDMVASAAPGDPDYSPILGLILCFEGVNYAGGTYTSEQAVIDADGAGELDCNGFATVATVLSPVVHGP